MEGCKLSNSSSILSLYSMNYQFEFYYSNIKAAGSLGNGGTQKVENHLESLGRNLL